MYQYQPADEVQTGTLNALLTSIVPSFDPSAWHFDRPPFNSLAQMRFPGRHVVFLMIVGLLIVPIQMTLIPILRLYNNLNVTGTFPGLWLAHAAYGLSFAVYLMRNYIDDLPKELFDIAEIDGADNFTVFYRLVVPLTVPALASLAIFQFIWAWNDLLVALVYLGGSPDVAPLTIAISNLVGSVKG